MNWAVANNDIWKGEKRREEEEKNKMYEIRTHSDN